MNTIIEYILPVNATVPDSKVIEIDTLSDKFSVICKPIIVNNLTLSDSYGIPIISGVEPIELNSSIVPVIEKIYSYKYKSFDDYSENFIPKLLSDNENNKLVIIYGYITKYNKKGLPTHCLAVKYSDEHFSYNIVDEDGYVYYGYNIYYNDVKIGTVVGDADYKHKRTSIEEIIELLKYLLQENIDILDEKNILHHSKIKTRIETTSDILRSYIKTRMLSAESISFLNECYTLQYI